MCTACFAVTPFAAAFCQLCQTYDMPPAVSSPWGQTQLTNRRHPTFYPGSDGHCIRNSLDPAPCDSRRLYLHQLCGDNHWHVKSQRWDNLTLWFIDDSPQMRPVYADGGGPKGAHPFMPCVDGVAWTGVQQGY